MGPGFFIMAILGCGEADAACQQIATVESRYESMDACSAATAGEVERRLELPYPVVVAQCERADAEVVQTLTPAEIDLPAPIRQPLMRRAYHEGSGWRG